MTMSDVIKIARNLDQNFDGSVTRGEVRQAKKSTQEEIRRLKKERDSFGLEEARERLKEINSFEKRHLTQGIWKYFKGLSYKNNGTIDISPEQLTKMDPEQRKTILLADGPEEHEVSDGVTTLDELVRFHPSSYFFESEIKLVEGGNFQLIKRATNKGVPYFEIDLPGDNNFFGNHDLALNENYEILVSYRQIYTRNDYQDLLRTAGIREQVTTAGVYEFYLGDKKLPPFEAFSRLRIEAFLVDEFIDLEDSEKQENLQKLRDLFLGRGYIPISVRSIFRGPGPLALRYYDMKTCKTTEIKVNNLRNGNAPPNTIEDYLQALQRGEIIPERD